MATHSSILAWKISWTEEPGGLQSMGSQRVRHDWVINTNYASIKTYKTFWNSHQKKKKNGLVIIGEWNTKVGSQEIPGVTGKFGLGVQNEAGQRLTEFCQKNALVIAFFLRHKRWLYTWTSPDGQYRNQIDYFFAAKDGEFFSIQLAKTRPGADCGLDHDLLTAKFRLKWKNIGKTTRLFRYDLNQIPYNYTL